VSGSGWIAIGLVGGAAAGARYLCDSTIVRLAGADFPMGILVVNLVAALALGAVAGSGLHGEGLTIVAGGAIGSFSTFSTWMLDTHLLRVGRGADLAWLNVVVSLVAGSAAFAVGHQIIAR
jgi:fluoride exporter